ncbi:MAG: hypothetical protein ACOY82_10490 [Pseudomonadota bacterium]
MDHASIFRIVVKTELLRRSNQDRRALLGEAVLQKSNMAGKLAATPTNVRPERSA